MTAEVNIGGVWKEVTGMEVNIAGTWKAITGLETNIGGVWKEAWVVYSLANLNGSTRNDTGGATTTYQATITFQLDRTVDCEYTQLADELDVDEYVNTGSTAGLYVRCTWNSGDDMTSGSTRGAWHQLDAAKGFIMTHVSSGGSDFISGNFDFEIATDSGGTDIVATASSVTVTVGEII